GRLDPRTVIAPRCCSFRHQSASCDYVCFTPESGHVQCTRLCPLWAKSGHRSNYSITSSARASSAGGTVMPSDFAILRLIANSNLVGCTTGKSENTHLVIHCLKVVSVAQKAARGDILLRILDGRYSVARLQSTNMGSDRSA